MRELVSKDKIERKRKRNQIIAGVVLVFVMLASTLGYAIQSTLGSNNPNTNQNSDKITYNGYDFVKQNGFWVLGQFVFRYNPKEVPDIDSVLKPGSEYQGKPVYVQSIDDAAESEIYVNMRKIAERVQKACLNASCGEDLPIKTCNDNFIIIKEGQINSINQTDGCVYIEGKKEDLVKLADQYLFKILSVK